MLVEPHVALGSEFDLKGDTIAYVVRRHHRVSIHTKRLAD